MAGAVLPFTCKSLFNGLGIVKGWITDYTHFTNTFFVVLHLMNLSFITIIAIIIVSCKSKTADWQTLDFKAFTLKTPQGWRIMEAQGIDSYVGGLTNGRD